MLRNLIRFITNRLLLWCGAFFVASFAMFLFFRTALHRPPDNMSIYVIACGCGAFFIAELIFFIGELTAKLNVHQVGRTLYITKGSSIVATVILKDDRPLSDDEIAVIIEDVARFAGGER
jgi:hypothetical protein